MPQRVYTGPLGPSAGGADFRIPGHGVITVPTDGTPVEVTADQAKHLDATGQVAAPKTNKSEED